MRILIVEDSPAFAGILRRFFEQLVNGEIVSVASWAQAEGLLINPSSCFDVVVLDLYLGDSTGPQTLSQCKVIHKHCPGTAILAISGVADAKKLEVDALDAGADAVLHKGELTGRTIIQKTSEAIGNRMHVEASMTKQLSVFQDACRYFLEKASENP